MDFALGGKPRVDRDCDPVSDSFQVLGKCGDYTVHKQAINLLFSSPQPHAMHQINLADAILNAVDFALGGVDRDCDPDPWRTAVR